jgi:MYXO-CTERM domain-containing protein
MKSSLARTLLSALAVAILLLGKTAFAGGNLTLKTADVQESSGTWHIKVRIDLPRAPSMMHTPMRFTFSKEAVDERAIMSKGAEPVHHRNVLDTPPKQIVGMDVDFADASGKVFKSTNFEFDLARKDGYFEAGEYTISLSGPDGDIGGSQKLVLRGDNPPVYRGAMDFADDKKAPVKKKNGPDMQNVGGDGEKKDVAQNDTNTANAAPASTEVAATGEATSMIPASAGNATADEEAVKAHPSGCGCIAAGAEPATGTMAGALAALLGLVVVVGRRRRA